MIMHECQAVAWFDCKTEIEAKVKVVTKLKCQVCTKYMHRTVGRKASNKCKSGVDSIQTTNVTDHAKSDQCKHEMNLHGEQLQAQV